MYVQKRYFLIGIVILAIVLSASNTKKPKILIIGDSISIVIIIKEISDAELIFVTTTYVPEKEGGRFKKDVRKYNKVAKEVMKKHAVLVNDIYKESRSIHKENGIGSDDVHYKEEGNVQLGNLITEYLNKFMGRDGTGASEILEQTNTQKGIVR